MELTDRQQVCPDIRHGSVAVGGGGESWALREEARKERREDPSVLIEADTERARTDTTEEGGKIVYLLGLMVKRVVCWKPDGNSIACVRTSTISSRLRYGSFRICAGQKDPEVPVPPKPNPGIFD